jgi:hypothetical protein
MNQEIWKINLLKIKEEGGLILMRRPLFHWIKHMFFFSRNFMNPFKFTITLFNIESCCVTCELYYSNFWFVKLLVYPCLFTELL